LLSVVSLSEVRGGFAESSELIRWQMSSKSNCRADSSSISLMQVFDCFAAQKYFVSCLGLGYNAAAQLEQGSSVSKLYLIGGRNAKSVFATRSLFSFFIDRMQRPSRLWIRQRADE
jgi:hypothetical protein